MVRIITNFYEVKILYQKLLRFQSCKLVIEQSVVQNCIKYCGIKKGQIPCEIFHNSNQIRFSHWIPSSSSTFTFIFYASGLSHRYLRKKRRSLALVVRIQFKFNLFWFHFVVRIDFNLFWIHSHCLVILGEVLSPLCNPNFPFFQRKTLNLKKNPSTAKLFSYEENVS